MGKYLLSVDNGLTTTKSVIFTLDGREIASSLVNTVVESKGENAEIDMELQWKNTAGVIKESIYKAGINPGDIVGIGNSGHGAGLYCLDSSNRPVRKAISSMDARSNAILDEWRKQGKSPYGRLYQNFWSGQAVPVLNWLKRYETDSYKKIEKVLMVKDWIIFKLTGEIGIEYTDASNSGLINPISKDIDANMLNMFGVGEIYEKIPRLRKTTDITGYVTKEAAYETGLKEGTPVMGGVYDCIACSLGSGVFDSENYSLIAGTWNVNSGIEDKLIIERDFIQRKAWFSDRSETIKCSLFADINKFFYVESSATSAVNLEWFIDNIIRAFCNISSKDIYGIIEEKIEKIEPQESNVIYMPFLYKSHLSEKLDACFWGIKPEYDIFHMLRGIFEGVAFAHRKHIENLKHGGIIRNRAVLSGGASNNRLWCQMFADVLDMEVITTQTSQVGALGTAVCTSVAMGQYRDLREAIGIMIKEKDRYYPDAKRNEAYTRKYKEFNYIIDRFDKA